MRRESTMSERTASRGTAFLALMGFLILGAAGLLALRSIGPVVFRAHHDSVGSLPGRCARPPLDVQYTQHARTKHMNETLSAEKVHRAMLEGHCVDVRKLCAERTQIYTCIYTPKPGLVGILIIDGANVITGFGTSPRYVHRQVDKGRWHGCY